MVELIIMPSPRSFAKVFWCGLYASGVIGMLVVYGLLQERIMTITYAGAAFEHSVFLVFLNRLAAVMFAMGMVLFSGEPLSNQAPLWKYLVFSMANVIASTCQYEALKYLIFAVQMVAKSFKMMPVMLWGIAISGKAYTGRDWAVAAAVTVGVTEFLLTGPTAAPTTTNSSAKGFALMLLFLALDGLTSTMQEHLFKVDKASKYNQMMYANGLASMVSLATLSLTGSLRPALAFFFSHGTFAGDAVVLSCSAVGGQFFIYSLIKDFGALTFAATMNVRQVVSIAVSYLTYGHHITPLQVLGLTLAFGALFYKSWLGIRAESADGEKLLLKPGVSGVKDAVRNYMSAASDEVAEKA